MGPLISVVTPSLNAVAFIRQALDSVVMTSAGQVEHIVVDGGSTDGTREVLAEYGDAITVLEHPGGPYEAINAGFGIARGEVLAWLNADDFYLPGALDVVAGVFATFSEIRWLTTRYPLCADAGGHIVAAAEVAAFSRVLAYCPDRRGRHAAARVAMQQESTFWRRSLWLDAGGGLDEAFSLAADFELWLRFWRHAEVYALDAPLGCFRWRENQRSRHNEAYAQEATRALAKHGGHQAGRVRSFARKAALLARGCPHFVLRRCPFAVAQRQVSYDREAQAWRLGIRHAVPV